MKETIQKISPAILEETVRLEVDILPKNKVHRLLQKWKIMSTNRKLEIAPIKMGALIQISGILCRIDIDLMKSENLLNDYYDFMTKHGNDIARVIAYAVRNKKGEPSTALVRFILNNFSPRDLVATAAIVARQMDVSNFITSMVLIGKMNLHDKASPADQGSQIASGELSVQS